MKIFILSILFILSTAGQAECQVFERMIDSSDLVIKAKVISIGRSVSTEDGVWRCTIDCLCEEVFKGFVSVGDTLSIEIIYFVLKDTSKNKQDTPYNIKENALYLFFLETASVKTSKNAPIQLWRTYDICLGVLPYSMEFINFIIYYSKSDTKR